MPSPPSDAAASLVVASREFSYETGAGRSESRAVPVEAPIEFAFGGVPFAVMMGSPRDIEDFAYGFAFTEGIVDRAEDVRGVEVAGGSAGFRVAVALSADRLAAHLARARAGRSLVGRTGCGVCGVQDLESLPRPARSRARRPSPAPSAVKVALTALDRSTPLSAETRAVHSAAWCDHTGAILVVREDVGRHNALDKTIGALLRLGAKPDDGFFLISSRCSFEMVAKVAAFGAGAVVAVSAPTSLALQRAREAGVEVIAIARPDRATEFMSDASPQSKGRAA